MTHFHFRRECRTPYSECYNIFDEALQIGRVDLHFTSSTVHATLCVNESLTQSEVQQLVDIIEEELVDSLGVEGEEFIVHIYQGRDLGIYSNHEFGEDGNREGI